MSGFAFGRCSIDSGRCDVHPLSVTFLRPAEVCREEIECRQTLRNHSWFDDSLVFSEGRFIADRVQLVMVAVAKRDRELVGDFESQSARLRKAQVMRLCRVAAADRTRLGRNKREVGAVAKAFFP